MKIIGYGTVRARKAHRCDYCAERIEPGTVHVRWACAHDGSVRDARGHVACEALACSVTEPGDTHEVGLDVLDYAISEKPVGVPLAAWLALEIPDVPEVERERFVAMWDAQAVKP